MSRKAKITRKTKETSISVAVNLDGKGKYKIKTGIGFLDHMLEQLSKHSLIDLDVKAKGDTHTENSASVRFSMRKGVRSYCFSILIRRFLITLLLRKFHNRLRKFQPILITGCLHFQDVGKTNIA